MIKPTNQIEIKPQRRSLRSSVKSSITNNQQTSARLNPVNLAEQIIQCRICLQESQQSSKAFIKPCLCSGSVSFVHKECLQTWIKQRMNKATVEEQQRVIQKQAIECQMCKKDIPFCFEQKLKEINLRQIHSRIQAKPCVTLLLLTALLLVLFALGFVGVMMKDVGIDFKGPHQIESIILTISMVILPFFVLLIIYLFLDQFVFTYEFVISLPGEIIHSFEIFMPQARNKNQGKIRNSKKESDTSQNLIRNSKINQSIHKPKVSGMLIQQLQ